MSVFCVSTVTSGHFQHYIPLFAYTLRMSAPRAFVKVFHRGKIDDITNRAMHALHERDVDVDMPVEDRFTEYPDNDYTTNCLRFLAPYSYFEGMNYVYWTDVDFVFFPHSPPLDEFYAAKLRNWDECYWGRRGPKRNRKTEEVTHRIAGGGVLVTPQWYTLTKDLREKMRRDVMNGVLGKVREDDEKMLWNICAGVDLKCPTKRGNQRPKKYKELHLGDFKFDHRWTSNRK